MYDCTFFSRSRQLAPARNAKEPHVAVFTADNYEVAEHIDVFDTRMVLSVSTPNSAIQ
jgi:hypothetical protein